MTEIGTIDAFLHWKRKNSRGCMIALNIIVVRNTRILWFATLLFAFDLLTLSWRKMLNLKIGSSNPFLENEVDNDEGQSIADYPVYVNARNEKRFFGFTPIQHFKTMGDKSGAILSMPNLRQEKALHLYHLIREYKLFEWWC